MSIFETVAETKTEKKKALKSRMISNNIGSLMGLKHTVQSGFDSVWDNEEFTAQEVMDIFGTDAKSLLIASASVQGLIKQLDPEYELLQAPNEVTLNADGTVTVGAEK